MLQKTGKKILFFLKVIIFFLFIGGLYYLKNNDEFWFNLGFVLEKSSISGVAYSDELEISRKLQTSKGKIIFKLNLSKIKSDIESIEWVKYAEIRRILPNTINVQIEEQVPMAIWRNENIFFLVDVDGLNITSKNISDFNYLPQIEGTNANIYCSELLLKLQNIPDIFLNLQKAVYIQDRRWNIELKNNLLIKLPEDKKIRDNALERLQKLIHEKSLLDKKWMVIDLRFPGKIILKSRPSQEKEIESSSDI